MGMVGRNDFRMIHVHYIYRTLYFLLLLHELQLRSSGIRSYRLRTPVFKDKVAAAGQSNQNL